MATATRNQPNDAALNHQITTQAARNPLTLWHLLSLDAPTVAALWTWFIASANHIHLPLASILAMTIAVWMLSAADRLLDARIMDTPRNVGPSTSPKIQDLEARHYFHHHHRSAFLSGMLLVSIALAILLPRLEAEVIHLYLILGGLLFGYFILIHASGSAHRLPKEIAVGLFFAAATFIPTVARRPDLRISLLPLAILFATFCSLNCLFIYAWEHSNQTHSSHPPHALTSFALRIALTGYVAIPHSVVYRGAGHLCMEPATKEAGNREEWYLDEGQSAELQRHGVDLKRKVGDS